MVSLAASAGNAIALGVGGIVAVLAVCAVFYVIGRGEDRDRASAPPVEVAPASAPDPAPAEAPPATAPGPSPAAAPREPAVDESGAARQSSRPRSPGTAPRRRRP